MLEKARYCRRASETVAHVLEILKLKASLGDGRRGTSNLQPRSAPPNTKYNQKLYVFVKPSGFTILRAKVLEEGCLATMLIYLHKQQREESDEDGEEEGLIVVARELLDI